MEQITVDGKEAKDEVAIYALKVCHKVFKSWSVRLISRRAARAFIEGRLQGHCGSTAQMIGSRWHRNSPHRTIVDTMPQDAGHLPWHA